jgi:hypothetical protein
VNACEDYVRSAGLNTAQIAFVLFDDGRGYAPHTEPFDGFGKASWYEVILRNTRSPDVLPPKRRTPNAQPLFRRGPGSGHTTGGIAPDSGTDPPPHHDPEPDKGVSPLEPSTVLHAPGTGRVMTSIRDRLVHISRGLSSLASPDSHQSDLLRRTTC